MANGLFMNKCQFEGGNWFRMDSTSVSITCVGFFGVIVRLKPLNAAAPPEQCVGFSANKVDHQRSLIDFTEVIAGTGTDGDATPRLP